MTTTFKWIPEAPKFSGYYALPAPKPLGKLGEKGYELGTYVISEAIQFDTLEDCDEWCKAIPQPEWKPTQHGFYFA